MHPNLRRILVIVAVGFAIAAPALQAGLGLGLSASEFADAGNGTLRASGYAFSIWGLIYLGLVAYATWQALPPNRDARGLDAIAAPSIVAISGCGLWICASAGNLRWASVAIIVGSAAALTAGLCRRAPPPDAAGLKDRLFIWWPLALLAGWLTVASAINILTVLTAEGLLDTAARAAAWAGLLGVLVVALFVLRVGRIAAYGLPIAWGLIAVWHAERDAKPDVAMLALVCAILVGAYAAWQARRWVRAG